jgi:hypothetical protein
MQKQAINYSYLQASARFALKIIKVQHKQFW